MKVYWLVEHYLVLTIPFKNILQGDLLILCVLCFQVSLPREYSWPEANLKIVVLPDE